MYKSCSVCQRCMVCTSCVHDVCCALRTLMLQCAIQLTLCYMNFAWITFFTRMLCMGCIHNIYIRGWIWEKVHFQLSVSSFLGCLFQFLCLSSKLLNMPCIVKFIFVYLVVIFICLHKSTFSVNIRKFHFKLYLKIWERKILLIYLSLFVCLFLIATTIQITSLKYQWNRIQICIC